MNIPVAADIPVPEIVLEAVEAKTLDSHSQYLIEDFQMGEEEDLRLSDDLGIRTLGMLGISTEIEEKLQRYLPGFEAPDELRNSKTLNSLIRATTEAVTLWIEDASK